MSVQGPIRRLAIVNRGEAAMRCIRSVKALRAQEGSDLTVIALYTDVDRDAPFVRHADLALRLTPRATAVACYLDHDLLLRALRSVQADAVWPGWGFVAESPDFVDKLDAAGIRFLGPSGDTMRRLGDKIASKLLAEAVDVPVTAWSGGVVADHEAAIACAQSIGVPVAIKASAGGGGRGIRMVEDLANLPALFQSAGAEARSAFGDGRLFVEKMIRGGRHIEVQIVADKHGYVRALGCRDCSVQRRHQKVLEEAPPSGLSDAAQASMRTAAERLAREVNYSGVGTVEFLVQGETFYFLEMNPRLQVEHGITEEVVGLDLVELQIRVARGERLDGLLPEVLTETGFCIEARVCAEDPQQGFLPAPGAIVRFDPALGPHVRVDTGVVVGSSVPPDFDSLIAKVMARGATREQARTRLLAALTDCDLVIHGGATNKGYLLELLRAGDYCAGGVDTTWLDRWNASRRELPEYAAQALVLAAVLSYRTSWKTERRNFFADTSSITADKVPAVDGREVDLEYAGQQYRLRMFSVGALRYRVHLDGRVVSARFGEAGEHSARVVISGKYYRATHDINDAYIRLEVEGRVHRFGRQTAGQVRAGTPSMVVSVDVKVGDTVQAGSPLGLLEAMKMEIAFTAPVSGVVTEVRVVKGQQVAAGEVLMVLDPSRETGEQAENARLQLPAEDDPLAPLFDPSDSGWLGVPNLVSAAVAPEVPRRLALDAINEEVERTLLGFDIFTPRYEKLLEWLEADVPEGLSQVFLSELSESCMRLVIFADVTRLFARARSVEEGGVLGPSNNARLRVYLRRMRSEGAGIAPEFLAMLKDALAHYGLSDLKHSDDLERSVLRMFATRTDVGRHRRLVMAMLRRLIALLDAGLEVSEGDPIIDALARMAEMRGEVSNALADTALEAHHRAFQGRHLAAQVERTTREVDQWLSAVDTEGHTPAPPASVLEELAIAPRSVFLRVEAWLRSDERFQRVIALSAYIRRLYAPRKAESHRSELRDGRWIDRSVFGDELVLGVVCGPGELSAVLANVVDTDNKLPVFALEAVIPDADEASIGDLVTRLREEFAAVRDKPHAPSRITLSFWGPDGEAQHETLDQHEVEGGGIEIRHRTLHGLHPETAQRIDLKRYRKFNLERLWGPEDIYCFHARSREDAKDERLFVLGDVRGRPSDRAHDAELFTPIFERAFQEAARTMRLNLGIRDPRRELHWNRIVMHVAHPVTIDVMTAQRFARRLLSNIRYLGMEKTIVRLKLLNQDRRDDAPREVEVVGSDLASSRLALSWRKPRRKALVPASPYERRVAAARRRGQVYPYEIIRMLTSGDEARERAVEADTDLQRPVLPVGVFEEHDLDPSATAPTAVSVAGREAGLNESAIVFGLITTPTSKIAEGMRRVLILSDPTRGMGALAAPECDRVVAAIDLAERLQLPVEWIPISSGARIAMDSGTENLDATARVVRRIVTFTEAGGFIHLIITGINVGGQSYWDSLATMLMHTRGVLIMTPEASMVLTGSAALAASGSVSAEDEVSIGGHERVMGPNGQAQYFATDLLSAYQMLYMHYEFTYVVPGEPGPRRLVPTDPTARDICVYPYVHGVVDSDADEHGFAHVGDIFDDTKNPGRKRPFAMRALMRAVADHGRHLERWASHVGAETAIVWDVHLGGFPVCLMGIESRNVPRLGYRPADGPEDWNGGTLFPQSSKKVARALNAASGNRPVVILANLSGFDGSPESMRKLQLEYGAEIARAVVRFQGPIIFLVVSRYHGGAYVVFSRELKDDLRALALEGSFASVIGGGPAAAVIFPREVRARVAADPRIVALRKQIQNRPSADARASFDRLRHEVTLEKRAEVAAEFDSIHSIQRALDVGSIEGIIRAADVRPHLIALLQAG